MICECEERAAGGSLSFCAIAEPLQTNTDDRRCGCRLPVRDDEKVCLPDWIKREWRYKYTYGWHFYDIDYNYVVSVCSP